MVSPGIPNVGEIDWSDLQNEFGGSGDIELAPFTPEIEPQPSPKSTPPFNDNNLNISDWRGAHTDPITINSSESTPQITTPPPIPPTPKVPTPGPIKSWSISTSMAPNVPEEGAGSLTYAVVTKSPPTVSASFTGSTLNASQSSPAPVTGSKTIDWRVTAPSESDISNTSTHTVTVT